MKPSKFILTALFAGSALLGMASSASAFTVEYGCGPNFSSQCSSSSSGGTATASFAFSAYDSGSGAYTMPDGTTVVMAITITNTSSFTSNLSAFALNFPTAPPTTPTSAYYDQGTTPFDVFTADGDFNGNSGNTWGAIFDVCTSTTTCNGGQGGLSQGSSGTLYFGFPDALSADLDIADIEAKFAELFGTECNSAIRLQGFSVLDPSGVTQTSDKICGRIVVGDDDDGDELPEPGTLALLGLGLLGLGVSRRRKA